MAYTYHILFTGTAYTEFVPSKEPMITYQEVPGEIFLQPVIEEIKIGSLLNASVYTTLLANFFDPTTFGNQVKIKVQRNGVDAFFFRSSISNAKLDTEKKTFMFAPEPDDSYQDILDKYDVEYGVVAVQDVYPYSLAANAFVDVNFSTFTDTARAVSYSNTTGGVCTSRLSFNSDLIGTADKVIVIIRDLAIVGTAPAMNIGNASFTDISNVASISANGMYTLTLTAGRLSLLDPFYIEFTQNATAGNGSGTFNYEAYFYDSGTLTKGLALDAVVDALLGVGGMATGITVRSTYLFQDALPPEAPSGIIAYITAHPSNNYAAPSATPSNRLNNLRFCYTDDLTTDIAEDHNMTFRQFMDILKRKLRAFWYIDTEGYFRIEHEQYFRQMDSQINLTSATYEGYKPEIDQKLYIYDKSDSYFQIEYTENNAGHADFVADPFIYDYIKTSVKKKEITIDISTDIQWIIDNPGDATADGFLLVETELLNSHYVPVFSASRTAGYYYQNQYLSFYSLFSRYFKYFGEADEADINNGTTLTLTHVKEILRQGGIKFYHDGILTWYNPITLTIGTSWIKKLELDLSSGFYTIDVGYDPYNL